MIDGFHASFNSLIDKRLEFIFKSEDYTRVSESICNEFEEKLVAKFGNVLDDGSKKDLIDNLKDAIFDQTLHQSKLIYREGFCDGSAFFVETFLVQKR